eukprot:2433160-Amphidinium_carterae.1
MARSLRPNSYFFFARPLSSSALRLASAPLNSSRSSLDTNFPKAGDTASKPRVSLTTMHVEMQIIKGVVNR